MCDVGAMLKAMQEGGGERDFRKPSILCRYLKGQYVEYTDDSFKQKKERPPEEEYLGLVGEMMPQIASASIFHLGLDSTQQELWLSRSVACL